MAPNLRRSFLQRLGVSVRKRKMRLRRALGLVCEGQYLACQYFGAKFSVQNDGIGAQILLKRFEWFQITRMIAAIERIRPAVFIDVGANIGIYTCIIGCRWPTLRLVAIEPDPRNLTHFNRHMEMNGLLATVDLRGCAAGAHAGIARMILGEGAHGALSRIAADGTQEVQVAPLDEIVLLAGQAIAIKIDVEDSEIDTLIGAEHLLRCNHGYVQIEAFESSSARVREVIECMSALDWHLQEHIDDDLIFVKTANH